MGNREVKSDISSVVRSLEGCGRLLALVITGQVLTRAIAFSSTRKIPITPALN